MAMTVDPARQYQFAGGVDLARSRPEPSAEGRDDPVLDADIALDRVGRGRHRAVADHQIVFAHCCSPSDQAIADRRPVLPESKPRANSLFRSGYEDSRVVLTTRSRSAS